VAFPRTITTTGTTTAPLQTITTTAPLQTITTTAPLQTITISTVLTLIEVPVIQTQVKTITNLITRVETLTYTFEETSTTSKTTSSPIGTIPLESLFPNSSSPVEGFYIPAGTLNVSIKSNQEVNFEIMSSSLYTEFMTGKSVPMCFTTSCSLDQDGAKVGITSGSLFFQVTTAGTYYTWVDNDYSGSGSATFSGILGMVSQQTVTYVVTSTSLSTTTVTNQTITTMTDTTYTTSTVG
jgi:hypothetical protein